MILVPGTAQPINWTKQNLLDPAFYYPYAIIRDLRSDQVLAEFTLGSLGGDRWGRLWNVVQDPSGRGRVVEVEITIYEDEARTSVSGIYGRWTEAYTILDLLARSGNGGGGGDGFDAKILISVLDPFLRSLFKEIIKKPEPVDFTKVLAGIESVGSGVGTIASKLDEMEGNNDARHQEVIDNASADREHTTDFHARMDKHLTDMGPEGLKTAVEGARDTIRDGVTEGLSRGGEELNKMAGAKLKERINQEMPNIVGQFKREMNEHAKAVGKHIKSGMQSFSEHISKPLSVKVVHDKNEEEAGPRTDPRVERLIGPLKKAK